MNRDLIDRIVLVYLALYGIPIGLWASLDPAGWYEDFPGFGRQWVAVDGPYNQHLVTDVGAFFLALGVLAAIGAYRLKPSLSSGAGWAWFVFSAPHFAYHIRNLEVFSTSDKAANAVGLAFMVAIPLILVLPRTNLSNSPLARDRAKIEA